MGHMIPYFWSCVHLDPKSTTPGGGTSCGRQTGPKRSD